MVVRRHPLEKLDDYKMFYLYTETLIEDMSLVTNTANTFVLGRITAAKDVCILIPETCEYGTLHGKLHLAGVIKLRLLRWRDYAGLSAWARWCHKAPSNVESGESEAEEM